MKTMIGVILGLLVLMVAFVGLWARSASSSKNREGLVWSWEYSAWVPRCVDEATCTFDSHHLTWPCVYAPGTGEAWKRGATPEQHEADFGPWF